jgi:hypothetical protein
MSYFKEDAVERDVPSNTIRVKPAKTSLTSLVEASLQGVGGTLAGDYQETES